MFDQLAGAGLPAPAGTTFTVIEETAGLDVDVAPLCDSSKSEVRFMTPSTVLSCIVRRFKSEPSNDAAQRTLVSKPALDPEGKLELVTARRLCLCLSVSSRRRQWKTHRRESSAILALVDHSTFPCHASSRDSFPSRLFF